MNIPIFFQPHLSLDSGMDPPPEYTENVPPSDHKTAPSTPNGTPIRTPQFLSRTNSQTSDSSHDRGGFGNPYTVSNAVTAFKSLRSQRSSSQRSINSVSHAVSQNLPKSKSAHSLIVPIFHIKKVDFSNIISLVHYQFLNIHTYLYPKHNYSYFSISRAL